MLWVCAGELKTTFNVNFNIFHSGSFSYSITRHHMAVTESSEVKKVSLVRVALFGLVLALQYITLASTHLGGSFFTSELSVTAM